MKDTEQNINNLEKLQRAIELCEQGHSLSVDEIDELNGDEQTMDAYRTLFCARVAVDESAQATAEADWQRIRQRHMSNQQNRKKARIVRITLLAAAACALVLAVVTLTARLQKSVPGAGDIAQVNVDKITNVTLQNEDGGKLALTNNVSNAMLNEFDAKMNAQGQLVYQQKTDGSDAAVELHAISTPRGKDFNFVLSDGTHVWLNSGSRIEYPTRFEGGERVVSLQGEAYFAVAKDPEHPFIIKTSRIETRVLGTQLNVNDYYANEPAVTLVTGVAEVSLSNANSYTRLHPGQNATLKQKGGITVRNVNTELYTAWKDGFFSFDEMSLGETMRNIADWYGVDVVFDNPSLTRLRLRYFNERTVPLSENIKVLNSFGTFNVVLQGKTLHIR